MRVEQLIWSNGSWDNLEKADKIKPQICLLFGSRFLIDNSLDYYEQLKEKLPNAEVVISSTAGSIIDEELLDDAIIANLIEFEYTEVKTNTIMFNNRSGFELGVEMAKLLDPEKTAYSLVLSTTGINADSMLTGFNSIIKGNVPLSGGVAGDDYRFEKTLVGLNGNVGQDRLIFISFIGDRLHTYHGSQGGWDTFGPERKITKSEGNLLYEIDGKPALQLYKDYLGEQSSELPTSALHFPLAIVDPQTSEYIVRGVQNIDEESNSLILYGDVHKGDSVQLMKANFDRVIQGAEDSANQSKSKELGSPDFAILISCVARRLVLDQLVEEELSEAKGALGSKTIISGFYSYSELSPVVGDNACHLHNQTMTITSFYER